MPTRHDSQLIAPLVRERLAFLGISAEPVTGSRFTERFEVGRASEDGLNYAIDINGEPFLLTVWLADPHDAPKAADGRRDVYAAEYHDRRAAFGLAVSARAVIEDGDTSVMVVTLLRHRSVPGEGVQAEARRIAENLVDGEAGSRVIAKLREGEPHPSGAR